MLDLQIAVGSDTDGPPQEWSKMEVNGRAKIGHTMRMNTSQHLPSAPYQCLRSTLSSLQKHQAKRKVKQEPEEETHQKDLAMRLNGITY